MLYLDFGALELLGARGGAPLPLPPLGWACSQRPQDQSQALGDDQVHGIDQVGKQGGEAQEDASQVEDDDDGGPIQPQSQVPHPSVH